MKKYKKYKYKFIKGSYSPVRITSEFSVIEKEASELFILDLVFEISDYFICVVNDFTSLD
jgi:hypothetical protein